MTDPLENALRPAYGLVAPGVVAGEVVDSVPVLPPPNAPMDVARALVALRYTGPGAVPTLRHWRAAWWEWQGPKWIEIEQRAVRAVAYAFTENAIYVVKNTPVPWTPNRHKIGDLLEALAAVVHLSDKVMQPAWLDGRRTGVIVACANGLLDVQTRDLYSHTPMFFNGVAVPFDYEPDAPVPARWIRFVEELWPQDKQSRKLLAEWFGYVLSGRTELQKIALIVGPTRGGKGAIARVLSRLIGPENVAGPTLSSLSGDFGLAPLIGKPLAVISDARLSNARDTSVVVERLLSVSGEDRLTVNIKYREQWNGTLPARFMILSNELPQLGDASAAIAGRFTTLLLERSWLGNEDRTLEPALHAELPGILNWTLDGLARLEANDEFTRPPGADEAYRALVDLAAPVKAFIRDRCAVGPEHEVSVDDFYAAWKKWAEENGQSRRTKQTLGRDLRAAFPRVRVSYPRGDEDSRHRVYLGIAVRPEAGL